MAFLDEPENGIIDQATVSARPIGLRWGLILGLVSAALTLVYFMTEMVDFTNPKYFSLPSLVSYAVTIAIYYYALTQHRDTELGGYMTLGRALLVSFWMSLISGIIMAVFMYLYITVINPDFMNAVAENAAEQAEKRGQDPNQTLEGMEKMGSLMVGFMLVGTLIGSLVMGLIWGLIVGAIVRRDPPRPF